MNKMKRTLLALVLLIMAGVVSYYFLIGTGDSGIKKVAVVDSIDDYGYRLHDNETQLYKSIFEELKRALNETPVDFNKYAELVSKLYIIDFYTLDTKVTNHDIGGLDFWHPDYKENFRTKAKDTVYKYIQSDVYKDREQELPVIKSVELHNISNMEFTFDKVVDNNAIVVELSFDYEKDMGYPNKAIITLVHKEKMLYIVEVN